jgi:hypothetical protein
MLGRTELDTIPVGLSLDANERMFGTKREHLKRRGLTKYAFICLHIFNQKTISGQTYFLNQTGIPMDLIFALRIYHTTVYEYDSMENAHNDKIISHQNELKVIESLMELIRGQLKGYITTIKAIH